MKKKNPVKAILLIPNFLNKKIIQLFWNEQLYTRISAKHIHNNLAQTGNFAHDILPQNKAYIINQTFSSKMQSIAQIMAINSTHQC